MSQLSQKIKIDYFVSQQKGKQQKVLQNIQIIELKQKHRTR